MSENLKKFLELITSDKELEKKALACNDLGEEKGKLAMIELAKENGIDLTEADFEKKEATGELSDDELDAVAGGGSNCGCFAGGGGGGIDASDGKVFGCACVAYGQGGDGRANDANCVCALYGYGYTDSQWLHPTT
jgi:predicted ribosomally synthesized peptide with nif11-like leader